MGCMRKFFELITQLYFNLKIGECLPGRPNKFLGIGISALLFAPIMAFAFDPQSKLFEQGFESLSDIQLAGGSCTLAGNACTSSVLVPGVSGNAVEFKKSGFPLLQFPAANHINPLKGTIEFNYVPLGAPTGDWGSASPASKVFFHLHDPNITTSLNSTLKVGSYYDSSSGKNYLYFRYDGTSGCSSACQRETSTYSAEPGVIMKWDPETTHKIVATWDLTAAPPQITSQLIENNKKRLARW